MFLDVSWPGRDPERPERMVVGPKDIPLSVRICDGWGKVRPIRGVLSCVIEPRGPALEGVTQHGFVVFAVPPAAAGRKLVLASSAGDISSLEIRVVSRLHDVRAQFVVWSTRLVCLVCLISLMLLFPQTEEPLHKLGALTFAGLSLASLTAELVRRAMRRPEWSSALAGLMLGVTCIAWGNGAIVHNRSLDKITQAGDSELLPGEYGVRFGLKLTDALCPIEAKADDCVSFEPKDSKKPFWLYAIPESRILAVGCKPALPRWLKKEWTALGACKPDPALMIDGVDLAHLSSGCVLEKCDHKRAQAEVASERVGLDWSLAAQISSQHRRPTSYRTMRFEKSTADFPTLSLHLENRDFPMHSVSVSQIKPGREVLCPADTQGIDALGLTFSSGTVPLGSLALFAPHLTEHNAAETDVRCWFANVGRHIARYAVWGAPKRKQDQSEAVSTFRAQSDLVSAIPICVPKDHTLVDAELTLGENWSPSLNWTLQLPKEAASNQIRIIDARGRTIGDVRCPKTPDAQDWDIGPLFAAQSKDARGELTSSDGSRWTSAQHGQDSQFFWGCWRHDAPPTIWRHSSERWILASSETPRSYVGRAPKMHCYRYPDGKAEIASKCDPQPQERSREWYRGWGASECDVDLSDLCKRQGDE